MSYELYILLGALVLGLLQLMLATAAATAVRGTNWNLSSRDKPEAPLTGKAGRADRAFQNFKESFPFFLGAITLIVLTQKTGTISTISAGIYLAARVLYLPLYVFNVIVVRSLVWTVSMLGIAGILLQLFLA